MTSNNSSIRDIQYYYLKIKGNTNGTCFHYVTFIYPWIKSAFASWIPSILGICLNVVIANSLYEASRTRQNILTEIMPLNNRLNLENNSRVLVETKKQCTNQVKSSVIHDEMNSTKKISTSSNCYSKERQITIMLMAISISFMVLSFPYSAFELLRKLNGNIKFLKNRELNRFVLLLMDITHATNFILYCLTGQKFRKELKLTVYSWFKHFDHNNHKTNFSRTHSMKRFD